MTRRKPDPGRHILARVGKVDADGVYRYHLSCRTCPWTDNTATRYEESIKLCRAHHRSYGREHPRGAT